jgi:signal transduction histidine kinase/CheY-like chemotaxis protein
MTDISCRAFSYFLVAERRGLLDLTTLLAGLPITRAELEDPRARVSWDLWAELCDRAASQLGHDPKRLADSGTVVSDTGERGYVGYLGPVASLFASTDDMFDMVVRWGGPALYRSHEFGLEHLPGKRLRFTARLKPGYRPCQAWFQMIPGALQVLPRLVGQPDAVVETEEITPTSGAYVVSSAPGRTLLTRLRQTWSVLRAPRALSNELAFQQQQLASTIDTLRRTEGGFRSALDALPAYVGLHRGGAIVYANPALAAAVDRTEAALLGTPLITLIHPEDRDRFTRELLVDPASARPGLTVRLIGAGVVPRMVEAAALPPFDFGGVRTVGIIAIDVSERTRMAETLSILQASMPDLVLRVSSNGCLLDVQGGLGLGDQARLLRGRIGNSDWAAAAHLPGAMAEHVTRTREALARALETGAEQRLELAAELDVPRTYEVRLVPRQERDEVLVLVRDLTRERTAERQLMISERVASVGTLAAGVAHEINNPLTYVMAGSDELDLGLAALSRGETIDVAGLRALLAEVRDGVGRIRDIVASLRTFSRVDLGAAPTRIDPNDAVTRALAMCASELRHRATLDVELHPTPPVLAEPSTLIQVLVNLLINAAQAMPDDLGAVRRIRVVTGAELGRARIEVHDTGVGIAPGHLARIFDPFFTTKPVGEGTGLGLSISHRLITDLGGTIAVTSEVGEGSVFVVTLPAAPPEQGAPPPDAAAAPARARVLIVDDDPMVAGALARTVARLGHDCTTADSGAMALARMRAEPFDLVLCDLMMPGISGAELYAQVAALDPALAERFVFITGGAFTDATHRLVAEGSRPVLTKPPDLAALRQHLADAARRRHAGSS